MTYDARRFQITDIRESDQQDVRSLILQGLGEHWGMIDESLNRDLDDILATYGHGRTVVVRTELGDIVGTGTVVPRDGRTAEILRMSVAPSHRRTGLGRQIVEGLSDSARQWGAHAIVLETSSHWDDVVAFYLSCGFRITHKVEGEFGRDTWFEKELVR